MGTITKLSGGCYRVRIRRKGAPVLSRNFRSRREAEKWEADQESALAGGDALPLTVRDYKSAERLTFTDLLERYFSSQAFLDKRETTRKGEQTKAKHLTRLLGEYAVTRINAPLIVSYRDTRLREKTVHGSPVSRDQVRLEMALLCVVLELAAGEWQILPSNPCKGVKKPRGNARERRLSEEEEKSLRIVLMQRRNPKLLWFFLVAFYTGMRAGEIAGLRKDYFNIERKCLDLPATSTKNRQAKRIPLTKEAYNILVQVADAAEEDTPYLFSTKKRIGIYGPYEYESMWRKVVEQAGIKNLRFHDLRHEFVSRLFESTSLSDGQIASLTGHKSPISLWRYKHLRSETLRPAVQEVNEMLVQRKVMKDIEDALTRPSPVDAWIFQLIAGAYPDVEAAKKYLSEEQITWALEQRSRMGNSC